MKLLLFDIDGTLLLTRGAGRAAIRTTLEALLGRPMNVDGVSFAGKTDPVIVSEIIRENGLEVDERTVDQLFSAYEQTLAATLRPEHVELMPGIRLLLEQLDRREDVRLGLVTGNMESTARVKLVAAGLDDYFPVGAFGSDSHDRDDLPALAIARANAHYHTSFAPGNVFVIGDTAHDITCSRTVGAHSIAVCTGFASREELAQHAPDCLFDSLEDPAPFLTYIFNSIRQAHD